MRGTKLEGRRNMLVQEELATYNAVMTETGQALLGAASQLLAPGNAAQLDFEGDADEFGQYLCEALASYGASHLHCIGSPDKKILFLQQVAPSCSCPAPAGPVSEAAAHRGGLSWRGHGPQDLKGAQVG